MDKKKNIIIIIELIIILILGSLIIIKCINPTKQGETQDNKQLTENKNDTNKEKNILTSLEEYKSKKIEKVLSKQIELDNQKFQTEITAYNKNNELIWNFTSENYDMPQSEPFRVIAIVNQNLYIQLMNEIIAIDIETGNKLKQIDNIGFNCEYIYIDNNSNIYITSQPGGFSFGIPTDLTILNTNTNEIINTINLYNANNNYIYEIKDINENITIVKKQLENETELETKTIPTSEILNKNFNIEQTSTNTTIDDTTKQRIINIIETYNTYYYQQFQCTNTDLNDTITTEDMMEYRRCLDYNNITEITNYYKSFTSTNYFDESIKERFIEKDNKLYTYVKGVAPYTYEKNSFEITNIETVNNIIEITGTYKTAENELYEEMTHQIKAKFIYENNQLVLDNIESINN